MMILPSISGDGSHCPAAREERPSSSSAGAAATILSEAAAGRGEVKYGGWCKSCQHRGEMGTQTQGSVSSGHWIVYSLLCSGSCGPK